jgi:homoserine kinase
VNCEVSLKVAGEVVELRGRPATTLPLECRVLGPYGRTLGSSSGYASVEAGVIAGDATVELKRYEGEAISGSTAQAYLR